MDVYEVLYTTRAMRRLRRDPVPQDVQQRILDAAIRAPSGSNLQGWRFLLVDDPALIGRLAPLYRGALARLWSGHGKAGRTSTTDVDDQEQRILDSTQHLADHFEDVPLLFFSFVQRGNGWEASIHPATWSAMLAARAEGVGSCWTSVLRFEPAVLQILGVPEHEGWELAACVTMGYPTGRWGVARRHPVHEVSYRNHWGNPTGFEIPKPLWPR